MKKYHFVTPSNEQIVLDDQYTYRDFLTVEDLKYLFTIKMRLYSMEMFEIVNSKKEMLDYSTKLRDFPENHVFHILHIDIKKSTTLDTKKESEKVQVIVVNNTIKEPETVVEVEKVEKVEKVEVENEKENEKENKENKDIFIEKESEIDTKKEKEVQVIVEKNTIKEPETVVHFEHFEHFEHYTKNEKIEEKEKVESKSCVIS